MSRAVSINGKLVAPEAATVSVYDRGFLYGDSVFEALRTYKGVPFALAEHMARLARSAERVLISMPITPEAFAGEVNAAVLARAAGEEAESYVRVVLTRGAGPLGLDPDLARDPLRVILVEPLAAPPPAHYERGIAVAIVAARRATDDTAAEGAKVANYLASLLALKEAKSKGAAEAILADGRGHVLEGATSNVFVVKAGRLATPPVSAGILAGITRSKVMALAEEAGLRVDERTLLPEDLYSADEVFITSTVREILPVVAVDGRPVGQGRGPGGVTRALHRAFKDRVESGAWG
jgi:branched-chain amino acid aminotransferase